MKKMKWKDAWVKHDYGSYLIPPTSYRITPCIKPARHEVWQVCIVSRCSRNFDVALRWVEVPNLFSPPLEELHLLELSAWRAHAVLFTLEIYEKHSSILKAQSAKLKILSKVVFFLLIEQTCWLLEGNMYIWVHCCFLHCLAFTPKTCQLTVICDHSYTLFWKFPVMTWKWAHKKKGSSGVLWKATTVQRLKGRCRSPSRTNTL